MRYPCAIHALSMRYPCTETEVLISDSLIPRLYVLRRRGRVAETPVSQPSNSIGDKGVVSTSLGSSIGFELREARPGSQVVADVIFISFSHSMTSSLKLPLG